MTAFAVARAVLDQLYDTAAHRGVTVPERSYVADSAPVVDCAQITAHVSRRFHHAGDVLAQAPSALVGHPGFSLAGIELVVAVIRDVPGMDAKGRPPKPEAIESSAEQILSDADLVAEALRDYARTTGCSSLAITGWVSLGASGDFGGGQTTALVSLA